MVDILIKLCYVPSNAIEDVVYNNLLNQMWIILSIKPEDFHEPGVSERNILIFLQAVENIFLENMVFTYPINFKTKKLFGSMIDDFFFLDTEDQVLKIH